MLHAALLWMAVGAVAASPSIPAAPASFPPPPAEIEARREWLRARLDEIFSAAPLAAAKASVLVSEFEGGRVLYARNERTGLNAASNVKLVTSAAALTLLGPEFRWRTSVYGPAKTGSRWLERGGELQGDLFLKGSGDPTLSMQHLGDLAGDLAALGLRRIRGALVIDDSRFDQGSVAPAYDQKDESAAFRAPSSATSLNSNAVAVTIVPGAAVGAPARVVIEPNSPYLALAGRVITAKREPALASVETSATGSTGTTSIILGGRVLLGSEPRTFLRRVVHPSLFLGNTFRQILSKRGITIDKPLRVGVLPAQGVRVLATHDSPSLAVVAHELNKRSSNFAAEQVLRTLGAEVLGPPGTWNKGIEAVERYLDGIGLPRGSYRMTNGAGLYDSNTFSAEQISTVMRAALRDFRIASEFSASLSVAGADGTLAHRMGSTPAERYVRAKTGTLATASCLSGIAGAPGQKPLLFSILVNDIADPQVAREAQDRAAGLLVLFLDPLTHTPGETHDK